LVRDPFTVLDGGLSTALEEAGHTPGDHLWTARFVVSRPAVIIDAHLAYLRAGAEVIITSSYQASEDGFVRAGADPVTARWLVGLTTELARRAVTRHVADGGDPALVAASVGPYGAVLADGSEFHGSYDATWDEVRAFHRDRLALLVASRPDLLAIETVPSRAEAELLVDLLAEHPDATAWVSFTCAGDARTASGDPVAEAVAAIAASPQVVAVGVNCTAPENVTPALEAMRSVTTLPLLAYPNLGRQWDATEQCWIGPGAQHDIERHLADWLALGVRLVGGCCGVGPEAVADLAAVKRILQG
jgi:S-methylmethionine-dependent homocysteine/selenocysteine methylase